MNKAKINSKLNEYLQNELCDIEFYRDSERSKCKITIEIIDLYKFIFELLEENND